MDRPVPFEEETFQEDDLQTLYQKEKGLPWKIKGLASKLSYRLFIKYGNSKDHKMYHDDIKAFKVYFVESLAPTLLDSHL
jgi:hypothetical protein